MVRPYSGSGSKHRPFSDSYNTMNRDSGRFAPPSRSPRGFRGPPGKAPPSWRDSNSSRPHPYPRRPPSHMAERRERPGQWMQQNQNHFHSYPGSQDSHRGRRRSSPPRSSHPPPVQHRQSPHGPSHGQPNHRAPFFHGAHSHTSPSRHFNGPPSERRVLSPHTSFRVPQRRPSPAREHERNWGSAPRERHFGRPALGSPGWNGPGGYPHPPSGDSRPFGPPQRKPREFHGRSSYQERYKSEAAQAGWSAERDQRTLHHGEDGRESRRPSLDWGHRGEPSPHSRPTYRSPAWKPGPPLSDSSSRFYPPLRPQETPVKNFPEFRRPPPGALERGPPKRFHRESVRPLPLRGFRDHGLTLTDKSRLLKIRKFRAESVTRFKLPPPRPRITDRVQKAKPQTAPRKSKEVALKKGLKMPSSSRESSPNTDSKTAEPESDSETQMKSQRSVSAHSSSPIDRRLSCDLVVVSHWEAGHKPSTSPKNSAPWRSRAPKNRTGSSDGSLTLNERFTKLQSPSSSSQQQREGRNSGSPEKCLRKPDSFQGTIIPRAAFSQKPVFKTSQSIMTKYKNLQTLRHKAPQRPTASYRRW